MSCAAALLPGRFGPVICSGNGAADVCGGGGGRKKNSRSREDVERSLLGTTETMLWSYLCRILLAQKLGKP